MFSTALVEEVDVASVTFYVEVATPLKHIRLNISDLRSKDVATEIIKNHRQLPGIRTAIRDQKPQTTAGNKNNNKRSKTTDNSRE